MAQGGGTIRLQGRTVIVTGGARGLGAAYARALAAEGAQVVIADVLAAEGQALAADLGSQTGSRTLFVKADVADETDTNRMAVTAAQTFGQIQVLINNAGLYADLGAKKPFHDIAASEWDRVMAVNVRGTWQCVKSVFPYMRRQRYGKIINISSATVHAGTPGLAHYVASKAAVIGLTRALARELGAYNISVNAIAPGLVHNDASIGLNPGGYFAEMVKRRSIVRLMEPEDLVGTVIFLASPDSDFISGQTFVVDGGAAMA